MLKGYTKIELTNIDSKEIQIIEDSNMVTNAILELCSPKPYFGNDPLEAVIGFNSNREENINKIAGAVALISDTITQNPESIMIPAGNSVTAVGPAYVNSEIKNQEYGSLNKEESSYNEETKTCQWVWDFDTPQGNGVISCACLMPSVGARQVTGITSFDSSIATNISGVKDTIFYYKKPLPWKSIGGNDCFPLYIDINNGYYIIAKDYKEQFAMDNKTSRKSIMITKQLELDIVRIPGANDISLFDCSLCDATSKVDDINNHGNVFPTTKKTIRMPDSLISAITSGGEYIDDIEGTEYYYYMEVYQDLNNITIVFSLPQLQKRYSSIPQNGNLYIWTIEIDKLLSDDTYCGKNKIFNNRTGEPLYWGTNPEYNGLIGKNAYFGMNIGLFHGAETKKIYAINLDNFNNIQEIYTKGKVPYTTDDPLFFCGCGYDKKFRYGNIQTYKPSLSIESGRVQEIDLYNFIHYDKNQCQFFGGNGEYIDGYGDTLANKWGCFYILGIHKIPGYNSLFAAITKGADENSGGAYVAFYPSDLIITINNLPTPFIKTEKHTMKVTYLLSEK